MATPRPLTISERLLQDINKAYQEYDHYLSPADSFVYRRLLAETDKLLHVEPFKAYLLRSLVQGLAGDIELVEREIHRAQRCLGTDSNTELEFIHAQALAKLGYFSRAQPLFLQAERMKLDLTHNEIAPGTLQDMTAILSEEHIPDAEAGSLLDIAGEIARKRALNIKSQWVGRRNLDGVPTICVDIKVGASAEQLTDMMFELADHLSDRPAIPSRLHISFRSV